MVQTEGSSASSLGLLAVSQLRTMRSNAPDQVRGRGEFALAVAAQPGRLDHAPAGRRRPLLVLRGEIDLAESIREYAAESRAARAPDRALRRTCGQTAASPNRDPTTCRSSSSAMAGKLRRAPSLPFSGHGRRVSSSCRRCMTMTILPFALSLSRESAVELNQSLAAARRLSDIASIGFSGSSMRPTSAPRPVSTPPTESPGGTRRASSRARPTARGAKPVSSKTATGTMATS